MALNFTFHNVSINTEKRPGKIWLQFNTLHSTMFLLIRSRCHSEDDHQEPLHSTMFLLIRHTQRNWKNITTFTFHNVSINTCNIEISMSGSYALHSTMFLLILFYGDDIINMIAGFTFHNVSINTGLSGCPWFSLPSLHSTMFLLIPTCSRFYISTASLYIPQCFY